MKLGIRLARKFGDRVQGFTRISQEIEREEVEEISFEKPKKKKKKRRFSLFE